MSQTDQNLGYRGKALDVIQKAGCTIGDIVRVSNERQTYEAY